MSTPSLKLLKQHQEFLRARSVSDDVAAERGYRSAVAEADLDRLGFGPKQQLAPALVIPVHSVGGSIESYQIRPDQPRSNEKGKPRKYEFKAGGRMLLDVHPRLTRPRDGGKVPLIGDPSVPLFITEGIPKGDAAVSIGLCCMALLGVWNWRGSNEAGGKTALSDWESIALNRRVVYTAFDSDVMEKRDVHSALARLTGFLESRKAIAKLIYLPVGKHGEKVGLDDYIAREKAAGRSHGEIRDALIALASDELRKPTGYRDPHGRPHFSDSGRPTIYVDSGQLRERVKQALDALQKRNDPPMLFSRDSVMVRLRHETYELETLDARALLAELAEAADWLKHNSRSDEPAPADPSPNVISAILGTRSVPFPLIESVARAPFFTADGTLVVQPGYHPDARVYLALDPILASQLSGKLYAEKPEPEDVVSACSMLDELFCDFPFVDAASRTHAKALTLLPFVRLMIDGPTPNHAVNAPARGEGTGKGLLIQTACMPALGEVESSPETGDKEEIRKVLLAAMLENAPIVWFDNIKGEVNSGVLAAILTARNWIDRILGKSKRFRGRVLSTWCIAGNGLRFSREIRRRTIMIGLDANMPRAWTRTGFKHELPRWARENRAALISACIILVRNWIARGCPAGSRVLGSYENWARILGGILEAAGIHGFLENRDQRSDEADREAQRWTPFVGNWWKNYATNPVTPKDLLRFADEIIPDDGKSERSRATRLGLMLTQHTDASFEVNSCVDGYLKIVRADVERPGGRADHGYALKQIPKSRDDVREVREKPKPPRNPAKTKQNFSPNLDPDAARDLSKVREAQVTENKSESQSPRTSETSKGDLLDETNIEIGTEDLE